MRRALPLAGALLLIAVTAFAQASGIRGRQSQKATLIPADQYITAVYGFTVMPNTTIGNGLFLQQSTAGGVAVAVFPPFLDLQTATSNRRCLVWEPVQKAVNGSPFLSNGDCTLAFTVSGLSSFMATTNGWFQIGVGDTASAKVAPTGTAAKESFGIVAVGTAGIAGVAGAQSISGYVVAASNDTTYTPILGLPSDDTAMKFWIHADPGGGSVQFYVNDAIKATIASPVRTAVAQGGWALWINGDSGFAGQIDVGPLMIQRLLP